MIDLILLGGIARQTNRRASKCLDRSDGLWLGLAGGLARLEVLAPLTVVDETTGFEGTPNDVIRHDGTIYLEAFETATGRMLTDAEREEFIDVQHQANRWTYLGTGMTHPKFLYTLEKLGVEHLSRIEGVSTAFC